MNERILIIDDLRSKCELFGAALIAAGYCPLYPQMYGDVDTMEELVDFADAESKRQQIDAIILDVSMGQLRGEVWKPGLTEDFGGVEIYLRLRQRMTLDRCGHLIVASRFFPSVGMLSRFRPDDLRFVLRVFLELSDIKAENVFQLQTGGGFDKVIARLNEIFRS